MTNIETKDLVRRQLMYVLKEAYDGSEEIMKEVWEECRSEEETETVREELATVYRFVKSQLGMP